MSQENNVFNESGGIDPSFWRGMTERRLSRRSVMKATGVGIGSSLLLASGAGASALPNAKIGTKSWWAKQKLHHTVNFANWPLYIDVCDVWRISSGAST